MPRSVDVILRHGAVDKAKAGDRIFFTGSLVVVPDIKQLYKAGQVPVSASRAANGRGMGSGEGVTGLKALGVRDLTFRTAFIAQSVAKGSPTNVGGGDDVTEEERSERDPTGAGNEPTDAEKDSFRAMADSGTIYEDLIASLAPTISGHEGESARRDGGVSRLHAMN